jgi:hypothetical protein
MIKNRLYTITKGKMDDDGQAIRVEPTEYLMGLQPHETIAELQSHVESLAEKLEKCSSEDLDIPEHVEKIRNLVFEVEVAQGYLAQVFKAWKGGQKGDSEAS